MKTKAMIDRVEDVTRVVWQRLISKRIISGNRGNDIRFSCGTITQPCFGFSQVQKEENPEETTKIPLKSYIYI